MNSNYDIKYKIADLRASLAKEENSKRYTDYEFTEEKLKEILKNPSKNVAANSKEKSDYLSKSMPRLDEMKGIVEDILEFYDNNFRLYTSKETQTIEIRFFLHVKFMNEDGDADEKEIRIGCKNFAECGKNFLDKILYDKKEYFRNRLRLVLAHELYHSLHRGHCSQIGKKKFTEDIYEDILSEIFANYFAYAYLDDFLKEGDISYYNQKRNDVIDWYTAARYFGVGRKNLFPKTFSQAEIEEDERELQRLMNDKEFASIVDTKDYPVSTAEYSAGYVLVNHGRKFEDGKIGKNMALYLDLYNMYLAGNANDALLKLITVKENEYFQYKYVK